MDCMAWHGLEFGVKCLSDRIGMSLEERLLHIGEDTKR